ncbi:MAG: FAD-binding oxidoreductase [Ilumatobacter sp.]|nr:FAD-binding oxidoreductase [Ilumatobacter sp.]
MTTTRPPRRALLSGWGRTAPSAATLVGVAPSEIAEAVKDIPERGAIARGLGRSYGDPAQNGGGHVFRLVQSSISIDDTAGTVTVGGGVSIDELLARLVPRGWFVPVTPGTRFVTVGGAIASDIHGKNHHRDGSFGSHIDRIGLVLADTTHVDVYPEPADGNDHELFWATVGGMGLTGLIVDATFRLIPIETSRMSVETHRIGDLDETMSRMAESDHDFRYSVAWIDLLARGRHLGRGVLTNGEHATRDDLDAASAADPLAYDAKQIVAVPPLVPPGGVINRATVAAFNELWYRKASSSTHSGLESIPAYFHPLDLVGGWNRVYGRSGFLQYQFVVPHGAEEALRTVIERISAARLPIFLTVLKRFGGGNRGPLSFPIGGWTLAIDVASDRSGLATLLRGLDELVLDAGGRHYLAKDAHLTPADVRRGYPRLADWQAVRRRVDPAGVWTSDLSRRLALTD